MDSHLPGVEPADLAAMTPPQLSLGGKIKNFILHFLEMCAAMCVGTIGLSVLFFGGAALLGYKNLLAEQPIMATLFLAIIMTVTMIVWMRIRKHEWSPTLEMAGSSLVLWGLLMIALTFNAIQSDGIFPWLTRLACPAMAIPMIFRLNLYAGHNGHHGHA